MDNIYVKPGMGRKVRMPERGFDLLPEQGQSVPNNSYYASLIRFGDIALAKKPKMNKKGPIKEDN
ncbi:MAG: DUF2635 domain-containing protein [Arenicella sp.]